MASRDKLKKLAEVCVLEGNSGGVADAWKNFKKASNTVYNPKKFD